VRGLATVITAGIGKVTRSRNGYAREPTSRRVSASLTPTSPQAPVRRNSQLTTRART